MRFELEQFSESSKGFTNAPKKVTKNQRKKTARKKSWHSAIPLVVSHRRKKSTFGSTINETFAQYAKAHKKNSVHRPCRIKLRGSLNILVIEKRERNSGKSLVRQSNRIDIAELILSLAFSIQHRNCTWNSIRDFGQVKPVPIELRFLYSFYTWNCSIWRKKSVLRLDFLFRLFILFRFRFFRYFLIIFIHQLEVCVSFAIFDFFARTIMCFAVRTLLHVKDALHFELYLRGIKTYIWKVRYLDNFITGNKAVIIADKSISKLESINSFMWMGFYWSNFCIFSREFPFVSHNFNVFDV